MKSKNLASFSVSLTLSLMMVLGDVCADEMGSVDANVNVDASLEGEFAREFKGVWGRALSNLQIFTGSLGDVSADPITNSGDHARPYMVAGDTFPAFADAYSRSCANQNNKCADAANNPAKAAADLSVEGCQTQECMFIPSNSSSSSSSSSKHTSSHLVKRQANSSHGIWVGRLFGVLRGVVLFFLGSFGIVLSSGSNGYADELSGANEFECGV
ncbi:putative ribosomal protein s17 protein [Botrytis fragariae]|uniref:Putative ribosomal protein s17 protein n=1 Tax=Botrytis fragariae TaxID=1964551 RepID=A0A8H6B1Z9_9HELO|nr:putative ribosomal protein s17 protein [Botrytis fragariae]KAF5877602.1 putative ribosomal protein s17 protein [Botrytis fragariae]